MNDIILKNIIEADQRYNNPFHKKEKARGLYLLDSVITKKWYYSKPTIIPDSSIKYKLCITSSADFMKIIEQQYDFLLDINYNNIMIAGDFVSSVLLNQKVHVIDLFVHSIEYDKRFMATQILYETTSIIINKSIPYSIINQKEHLTIKFIESDIKIRIHYKLYSSQRNILNEFDLGSEAIGFDGKHVHMSLLGKCAYECGYNVVDLTRISPTYEKNLLKYLNKGFGIIMPEFNENTIKYNNELDVVLDLPYFKIIVKPNNLGFQATKPLYLAPTIRNCRRIIELCSDKKYLYNEFMDYLLNTYVVDLGSKAKTHISTIISDYDTAVVAGNNRATVNVFINNNYIAPPNWLSKSRRKHMRTRLFSSNTRREWYGKYFDEDDDFYRHDKYHASSCIADFMVAIFAVIGMIAFLILSLLLMLYVCG